MPNNTLSVVLCTALALAAQVHASPARAYKSLAEVNGDFFGPLQNWNKVMAIDLFPNATFDGKTVDDTLVFAYTPPVLPAARHKQYEAAISTLKAGASAATTTRDVTHCWGGLAVPSDQLFSGRQSACTAAGESMTSGGGSIWQLVKNYYQKPDGSWAHFRRPFNGPECSVAYMVQSYSSPNDMYNFDWNDCSGTYWALINSCTTAGSSSGGDNLGPKYFVWIDTSV